MMAMPDMVGDVLDGNLEVTPSTLHAAAGRGQAIGKTVGAVAGRSAASCARAAEPHHGWSFGAELGALGSLWRRELSERESAEAGNAAKLERTADTYSATEGGNAELARSPVAPAGRAV